MNHAKLPPSSASMWVKCSGWFKLNEHAPEESDTEDSRLGTAVHELASFIIDGQMPQIGESSSNGVIWDEEAIECAETYANDVLFAVINSPYGDLRIESHVSINRVHKENSGTPDASLYDPTSNTLTVWDYKHGHGVVEVYENWQLLDYAIGLLDVYDIDGSKDQTLTIILKVVQPRSIHRDGSIREWRLSGVELRNYANILAGAAQANFSDKAQSKSGTHCKYCKVRHICPAALQTGLAMIEVSQQPIPFDLSSEAMGTLLSLIQRSKKHLESLEAGLEAQISSRLLAHEKIPNWEMSATYGREKWNIPFDEAIGIGEMFGVDVRKKEIITPKQAIALGVDAELVKAYSITPNNGLKLNQIDPTRAKRTFL